MPGSNTAHGTSVTSAPRPPTGRRKAGRCATCVSCVCPAGLPRDWRPTVSPDGGSAPPPGAACTAVTAQGLLAAVRAAGPIGGLRAPPPCSGSPYKLREGVCERRRRLPVLGGALRPSLVVVQHGTVTVSCQPSTGSPRTRRAAFRGCAAALTRPQRQGCHATAEPACEQEQKHRAVSWRPGAERWPDVCAERVSTQERKSHESPRTGSRSS
jgi:hypothetical protein